MQQKQNSNNDRQLRAAARRRRRERELRRRRIILGVLFAAALVVIGFMVMKISKRNAQRGDNNAAQQTAGATSGAAQWEEVTQTDGAQPDGAQAAGTRTEAAQADEAVADAAQADNAGEGASKQEELTGLEAYRKMKEEEAALEASRKAAEEEAALAASRKIVEETEAAKEAMKAQEEAKAAEAAAKAAEERAIAEGRIPGLKESYMFEATSATQEITDENIESPYAVIVDLVNGTVVAGKEYDTQLNPASMTKILTLLVAVENIDQSKIDTDTYTITRDIIDYVYGNGLSAVGWEEGDEPTVRSLLYGTILPSGADAAMALAEYTAGSEKAFVELMNKKLEELGISDTAHFTNVVGTFDDNHYCTALDMATILRAALDSELCRDVLSKHSYTVPDTESEDLPDGIEISNWFLRRIEDKDTHGEVICAKTGFVNESGSCAASYQVSNNGGHYICVTVGAPGAWPCIYDHVEIYDTYTE